MALEVMLLEAGKSEEGGVTFREYAHGYTLSLKSLEAATASRDDLSVKAAKLVLSTMQITYPSLNNIHRNVEGYFPNLFGLNV